MVNSVLKDLQVMFEGTCLYGPERGPSLHRLNLVNCDRVSDTKEIFWVTFQNPIAQKFS